MKVCWRFPQTARFFQSFNVHGSTLSDRYYCEFLWSWEKFLWRWSTVQPKMRYATVVVKVHAGKTTKWAHALMIGKESLKGWWILTTLKKWTGWAQALFRKVVGDRLYSSSVPIPSTLKKDQTNGDKNLTVELSHLRQLHQVHQVTSIRLALAPSTQALSSLTYSTK